MLARLLPPLFDQNALDYMKMRGFELNGLSNFLLMFLIYMEAKYAHTPKLKRLQNERQISNALGVHNTKVKKALAKLKEENLIDWFHDEGYSVKLGMFQDFLEPGRVEHSCTPSSLQAFLHMADLFFTPEKRKARVGRMDYLEKLLVLSLVISADELGRVANFDPERYGDWLGVEVKEVNFRLESLRATYGFIFSYELTLPLEEGLIHSIGMVIMNVTHPWLSGEAGFYVYCQLHGAIMGVASSGERDLSKENKIAALAREGSIAEGFTMVLQGCLYSRWLDKCKSWWGALNIRQPGFGFQYNGSEVEAASEMLDIVSRQQPAWQDIERLGHHWERPGVPFGKRCRWFYIDSFHICLQWALELVSGQSLYVQSMDETRKRCLEALENHRLLSQRSTFPVGSLKYHYLDMLHVGTVWVLQKLLDEACNALKVHPDFQATTPEKLNARFVTYLFDARLTDSSFRVRPQARLTGVMLFRVERSPHARVWGMEIPADEKMKHIFGETKYTQHLAKEKQWLPVYRNYRNDDEAMTALVGEFKWFVSSHISGIRKKSSLVVPGESASWIDFIENYATAYE